MKTFRNFLVEVNLSVYKDGHEARNKGLSLKDNPHPKKSDDHEMWKKGLRSNSKLFDVKPEE